PAGTGAAWAMGSAGQAERARRLFLRPLPWKGSGSWARTPGNVRDQMSHPERIAAFALSLQVLADRIRMAIPSSVLCFAEVSMPRALGRRIELLVTTRKLFAFLRDPGDCRGLQFFYCPRDRRSPGHNELSLEQFFLGFLAEARRKLFMELVPGQCPPVLVLDLNRVDVDPGRCQPAFDVFGCPEKPVPRYAFQLAGLRMNNRCGGSPAPGMNHPFHGYLNRFAARFEPAKCRRPHDLFVVAQINQQHVDRFQDVLRPEGPGKFHQVIRPGSVFSC